MPPWGKPENPAESRRKTLEELAKEVGALKVDSSSTASRDKIVERLRKLSEEKPPTPSEQTAAVREE